MYMKVNYKLTSVVLAVLLIIVLGWVFTWRIEGRRGDYKNFERGDMMHNNMRPMGMGGMMNGMTMGLEGKTGDEFDKAFLAQMTIHHQGAINMANLVLKNSKRPEMLQLAKDIISAQTKEIEMMKSWSTSWFASSTAQ